MERKLLFNKYPKLIHGGDYNPDQWLGYEGIFEEDIRMMKKAHVNCVTLGVFSWAAYEKEEGQYDFSWLIKVIDRLKEENINVIMATPSGARPAWLDLKYEEVRRVDINGKREHHRERHNHCYSSPIYRQKVEEIDTRLANAIKDKNNVILWHISNEFEGVCYCDKCRKNFQKFLKKRYQTIDKLNHEYWTGFWSKHFNSFEEVEPPYANGENALMGLNLDWKRFTSEMVADFMKFEIDTVRKITPDIPVTTNMMMFFEPYDYRVLAKELDIISWDAYPQYHNDYQSLAATFNEAGFTHCLMRSLKKQPFMLMESTPSLVNWREYNKLKKPGVHELASLQAIANGSDSVQYFQIRKSRGAYEMFHGALIDHNGRDDTRVFKEIEDLGSKLERLEEIAGSTIKARAAIVVDWENRWAIREAKAFCSSDKKYEKTVQNFYGALMHKGIETDIIASTDDYSCYDVIFLPMMFMLKEGVAAKLKEYVKNGGLLVGTYMLGYINENQLAHLGGFPGDGLMELFGFEAEEIDTLWPSEQNYLIYDNKKIEIKDYCEILKVKDCEAVATYEEDFYRNYPVVTRKNYGLGTVWYQAARFDANDLLDIIRKDLVRKGMEVIDLPAGIERHVREYDDKRFIFYLNESENDAEVEVEEGLELLSNQMIGGKVTLHKYQTIIIKA
ncbi:MAG: beta-galactosidase [Erysipelotrichaceae bacterium]|nr:beta-galactosidase [Erysipelotrichaceae bacterium]